MKLLIAYDGSSDSDLAIDDLQRAGMPADAHCEVMTVADVFMPPDGSGGAPELPSAVAQSRTEARQAVEEARETANRGAGRIRRMFPGWSVTARADADSPAWGVVKRADAWGADMIVVGAQGHGALERLVMGSVSSTIVAEARCTVRVARPIPESLHGEGAQRLICATDGSPNAQRAIETVAARSWPDDAEVRVLAVVDARMRSAPDAAPEIAARWSDEAADGREHGWVDVMLDEAVSRLTDAGIRAERVVRTGDPKQEVVRLAEEWPAHAIHLGARGLGRVERMLLGGMTRSVLSRAPCTVEVVR